MRQKSFILDWAIRFVFCLLYSNALTLAVSGGLSIVMRPLTVVLICSAATVVFYLLFGFRTVSKYVLWVVLGLIGIGAVVFGILCLAGTIDFMGMVNYVFDLMGGYKRIDDNLARTIVLVIIFAISLLSAFLLSRRVLFLASAVVALVVFMLQLLFGNIFEFGSFAFLFYVVIALGIYSCFTRFERASGGQDFGFKRLALIGVCLACAAAVGILTVAFPFANEYSQTYSVENLSPNAFVNRGQGYFQLSSTGVGSSDSYLGDTLRLDFAKCFELTSEKPLYLVASYNDTYTGTGWKTSDSQVTKYEEDEDSAKLLDSAKKLNDAFKKNKVVELDTMNRIDFLNKAGIEYKVSEVKLKFAKSDDYYRSVLRTSDLVNMNRPGKRVLWNDISYNLYTNLYFSENLTYSFTTLDYDLQSVYDYLQSEEYADGSKATFKFNKAVFDAQKERIYSTYTALPKTLPDRVKDLSTRIVEDSEAKTRYEKVWSMMEYLWRYRYRTGALEMSSDSDFVDTFLFGDSLTDDPSEEYYGGYCTGFASALAVMCRAQGIPARYVEGFSPLEKAGESLMVDNSYSHAWVEVYFDGVGWVMFEPTTHDADKLYGINTDDYKIKPEEPEEKEEEEEEDKPEEGEEEEEEEQDEPVVNPDDNKHSGNNDNSSIGNSTIFQTEGGFRITVKDVLIVLCILAVICALIMIPVAIVNHRKRQMARMYLLDNRSFAFVIWHELTRVLKFVDVKRETDETVHDFLKRISELCGEKSVFDSYFSFDKALYSLETLSDNDRAYISRAYDVCNAYAIGHSKKWWFNFNRYLLHRM